MSGPTTEYWTDPGTFAVGRRRGRALMDRFDSLADLDQTHRSNRLDLAGQWDFEFVDGLVGFDGHAAAAAGPQGGGRLPVPSLWQLHGHGLPIYLANTYPPAISKRHIPRIDQARNEAGVYGRTFEIPQGWAGRRTGSPPWSGATPTAPTSRTRTCGSSAGSSDRSTWSPSRS